MDGSIGRPVAARTMAKRSAVRVKRATWASSNGLPKRLDTMSTPITAEPCLRGIASDAVRRALNARARHASYPG